MSFEEILNGLDQNRKTNTNYKIDDLLNVMRALRDPDNGCPWDIEQNFASIAPYTLEEAYEVVDAIHREDMTNLREELGDLLLQTVYHAQMASELKHFDFNEVVDDICKKMLRRHPHVFGSAEERAAGVQPCFWENIKSQEKNAGKTDAPETGQKSLFADVPANLPSLNYSAKLQKAAARVGFDWPDITPVTAKVEEEWTELKHAIAGGVPEDIAEEYGDLMFVLANIARHLKIDPEVATRAAASKFMTRFQQMEQLARDQQQNLQDLSLEQMDVLWDAVKMSERS
ncbi:MAG: nucleoside triphosphate pyrophosphohydrolase [Methyloligellaceae bacterium]